MFLIFQHFTFLSVQFFSNYFSNNFSSYHEYTIIETFFLSEKFLLGMQFHSSGFVHHITFFFIFPPQVEINAHKIKRKIYSLDVCYDFYQYFVNEEKRHIILKVNLTPLLFFKKR